MKIKSDKNTKIYWGNLSSSSYFFGSTIKDLSDKSVYYENVMIPSAQILKRWDSLSFYQGARQVPTLPLLKKNHYYEIKIDMDVVPQRTVFLELVFKDRFGVTLESEMIKDSRGEFRYPKDAYSYQICLLSAGLENFHFKSIEIKEMKKSLES